MPITAPPRIGSAQAPARIHPAVAEKIRLQRNVLVAVGWLMNRDLQVDRLAAPLQGVGAREDGHETTGREALAHRL
jgi:hypothetical protein